MKHAVILTRIKHYVHSGVRLYPLLIGSITLVGFFLRIFQNSYGLPSVSHEEYVTLQLAWLMNITGNLDPAWFAWPALLVYIEYILLRVLAVMGIHDWLQFVVVARGLQAVIGAITIPLLSYLGVSLYNKKVGLFAALFIMFLPQHIVYSRLSRPEVMVSFFFLFSVLFAWKIFISGKRRYYYFSALAGGLAVSSKYNGISALIMPIIAHITYAYRSKKQMVAFWVLLVLLGIPLCVFILTNPFSVLNSQIFIRDMIYLKSFIDVQVGDQLYRLVNVLIDTLGIQLFLVSVASLFFMVKRHSRSDIFLLTCIGVSFLQVLIWEAKIRLLFSSVSLLLLGSAVFIDDFIQQLLDEIKVKNTMGIAGALSIIFLVPFFVANMYFFSELSRRSITSEVVAWFTQNASTGSRVYKGFATPMPVVSRDKFSCCRIFGIFDPHQEYNYNYDEFKKENYSYVILGEEHRQYLQVSPTTSYQHRFYTRLYEEAISVNIFDWDRRNINGYSAPYSQILRDDGEMKGSIYVLTLK